MAPSDVLERLSRLLRQLEPGRTATVVYLVVDPHGGGLASPSAGHPPPLVHAPGEEPRLLELPGSVPLGAARHVRYEDHVMVLEPGSVLVLYTDGFVERRERVARRQPGPPDGHGRGAARRTWSTSATRSSTCSCPRGRGTTMPRC